jgi:hypothetical protein
MKPTEFPAHIAQRIRSGDLPSDVLRELMASERVTKSSLASMVVTAFPQSDVSVFQVWHWQEAERQNMWDTAFNYQLIAMLLSSGMALPWSNDDCQRELARVAPLIDEARRMARQQALDNVSFKSLVAKVDKLAGKVACIESLWDGDTNGWFIVLSAVMDIGGHLSTHFLGKVSYGGDIRLFNGKVPPWPESLHASEVGNQLAQHYGSAFYFPGPDQPDDGHPSWLERGAS